KKKIKEIAIELLDELKKDNLGKADFIICIPEDMTQTQEASAGAIVMPPAATTPAGPMKNAKADTVKKPAPETGSGGDNDDDD
ncbi:MAG: hypothetical protein NTW99_05655, partial [Chloroflexi bacterium]|nr:hypothetical protein [Chloroflexota bacterium]